MRKNTIYIKFKLGQSNLHLIYENLFNNSFKADHLCVKGDLIKTFLITMNEICIQRPNKQNI